MKRFLVKYVNKNYRFETPSSTVMYGDTKREIRQNFNEHMGGDQDRIVSVEELK